MLVGKTLLQLSFFFLNTWEKKQHCNDTHFVLLSLVNADL